LGIAFFTLFERKILSYSQNRLGTNKVGGLGLLQPAFDGVKLLLKECLLPFQVFSLGFLIFPSLVFPIILCS
jgi:NADH-quinone oxidoreductase subunit H